MCDEKQKLFVTEKKFANFIWQQKMPNAEESKFCIDRFSKVFPR